MKRILKKYTTIPQHLYVERNADHQLKRIIEEMQRPGYVLVARQMGKTNLLFNAKRKLENPNRLLAYVDLSNQFDTERECYRNLINNITEPNTDLFDAIGQEIEKIRGRDLPPSSEYSRSLLKILEYIPGDLVVILDEIDALKSVEYSDNIFAQIRSNYFSRTNFPLFEKLTYVLSGVIEPTELIKDKNKSPFNIGEKIYLDDFTEEEHNKFIELSQLKISDDISHYIFEWTNGNPRLTFELCSEIELHLLEYGPITHEIIDQIVIKKYLTTFDIAPIDHIRELVKSNKQIRDAIVLIKNENTTNITDALKSKLYLYGIISSDFNNNIKIKNRIIDQTLNIEWIKSIEKSSQSQLSYGLENISQENWDEAITNLLEFVQSADASNKELQIANYNLGVAYHSKENFKKSIEFFKKEYSPELKYKAKSFIGIGLILDGQSEQGIKVLEEIISERQNDSNYRNAIYNIAVLKIKESPAEGVKLFEELYESTFNISDEATEKELDRFRVLCFYYLATEAINRNEFERAIEKLDEGLKICEVKDSITLLYFKIRLSNDKSSESKYKFVNSIVDNELKFEKDQTNPLVFQYFNLISYLNLVFDKEDLSPFYKLCNYAEETLLEGVNLYEAIYHSATLEQEKTNDMLQHLLDNYLNISEDYLFQIHKHICRLNIKEVEIFDKNFKKYLLLLKDNAIDNVDIFIFSYAIKYNFDNGNVQTSLEYCQFLENRISDMEDYEVVSNFTLIYFWYCNIYFHKKNRTKTIYYGEKTLALISEIDHSKLSLIDSKGVDTVKRQVETMMNHAPNRPLKINKITRNEVVKVRYHDGLEIEKKYKHLESDILANKCIII